MTPSTCPPDRIPCPVGRDKSGPYAILAALVQLRLMRIGHDPLALRSVLIVILSAAKDLASLPKRSFAALRMTDLLV